MTGVRMGGMGLWLLAGCALGLLIPAAPAAAQGISELAKQDPKVAALIAALRSPQVEERQKALAALAVLGAEARSAVPNIIAAFKDRSGLVRFLAVDALAKIGPEALPKVKEALASPDSSVRYYAAAALKQMAKLKAAGKATYGQLVDQDPFDAVRKDHRHKVHMVPMTAGKTYVIDLKSTDFDAYLRLEGPDGARLAEDDDSGGDLNARITFTAPKDGNYRVIATTFQPRQTGAYTLIVAVKGAAQGKTIAGQLTNQNPLDPVRPGRHHKVHLVPMKAGKSYTIDLKSTDFDSYLRLEGPDGTRIDEDDDSGGNQNARLTFTPQKDGMYRVIATTYAAMTTGTYTLIIGENPG